MTSNVWNIREMLSIPTGPGMTKSAIRNSAPSANSSLTDSQFLFGSQFYPENSESQDLLSRTTQKNSQQNSQQNESELKFYEKYQAKPYLFATENKETRSVTQFCIGKPKGFLEQFEISKRKAKEKEESEHFNNWISKLQDNVEAIKVSFNKLERKAELQNKSVLEGLENFSKTIQENINTHYETIVSALEAKSSREQILEMDKRLAAKEMEVSDLKTQLLLVQECLDGIKHSQCQQHQKMCEQLSWFIDHFKFTEILSEVQKLTSNTNPLIEVQNNVTQTTPSTSEGLCIVRKRKAYYESTRVCRASFQPQPALIDNCQLCDAKALCTDILPNGSGHIHRNAYQKTLSETAEPRAHISIHENCAVSSLCEGRNEETSSYSTAINSNQITSACPASVTNGLCSQAFIPGAIGLAESQNGSRSKSPSIHKMLHNKENKWGPVYISPSVKCNLGQSMWPDTITKNKSARTGGSAVTCRKIGAKRSYAKRRSCIPPNKKKVKLTKASEKSNIITAGRRKATLDELKIKSAIQKQSNGSEKKNFGKASHEKRRYPLEGLLVKDETWQEQMRKRNYYQQQKERKEIPKVAKRNLSWQPPITFQEEFLQNGMESEHLLQSWFSPLTPNHESCYDNPANSSLGKEAQNKTQLNFFDSSEDSD